MATETHLDSLKINILTKEQFNNTTKDPNQLYMISDEDGTVSISDVEGLQVALDNKSDKNHNHDTSYDKVGSADTALSTANAYTDEAVKNKSNVGHTHTASDVGALPISHDTSATAHNDIRTIITELTNKFNALANSDDTTLDQLSEIVAYIKANKSLIDSITTSKVNVNDIINNLTTNATNKPLSAAQGVALKTLIDNIIVPNVPDWALSANKPTYTAEEVGAAPSGHNHDAVYTKTGHTHTIANVTGLQGTLDEKAKQTDLDTHTSNATSHVTSTDKTNWNSAKTHADSTHAPSDAEKNQNAFSTVKVGTTNVSADTPTDTLTLVAGTNVTITPNATSDSITISATDTNTTYSAGTGINLSGTTFSNSGVRSVTTGVANGTISVNTNGTTTDVPVKGLGSAAYTASTAYDVSGAAAQALTDAKAYTDTNKVSVVNNLTSTSTTSALSASMGKTLKESIDAITTDIGNLGGGDMMKATYDTNGNGIVDNAEKLGGQLPSYYAKQTDVDGKANSTHTHTIANVTNLQSSLDGKVPTTRTINGQALSANISLNAGNVGAIATTAKGKANGVAELDASGKVPTSQLPSYVDDVLEYSARANFPATGEAGKIYIDNSTNKTYRWSGTTYVEISASLALGETSSTAYAGNKGLANAQAIENIKNGTIVVGKASDSNTVNGKTVAVNVPSDAKFTDTTYNVANATANGLMSTTMFNKLNSISDSADSVSFSRNLTSGTKVGTITINGTGTDLYAPTNTDTHYTSKNVVGATNATSNTSVSLTNGNVYLNSVENNAVTSSHKISGSGATTVTTDTSGNIIISSTDTNTTYTLGSFGVTATAAELNKLKGMTATTAELNYVDGVTSNIQTQLDALNTNIGKKADSSHSHTIANVTNLQSSLDGKQATVTGGASTITSSNLTANRALVSNASGKVGVSAVTNTELGYLSGATSSIQTQINGKANSSHTHTIANITDLQTALDDKANKPTYVKVIMYPEHFDIETKIYTMFERTYPASRYDLTIEPSDECSIEQYYAWSDAQIVGSATSNNLKAYGTVPAVTIPLIIGVIRK